MFNGKTQTSLWPCSNQRVRPYPKTPGRSRVKSKGRDHKILPHPVPMYLSLVLCGLLVLYKVVPPSVISCFIIPINYRYIIHKSQLPSGKQKIAIWKIAIESSWIFPQNMVIFYSYVSHYHFGYWRHMFTNLGNRLRGHHLVGCHSQVLGLPHLPVTLRSVDHS